MVSDTWWSFEIFHVAEKFIVFEHNDKYEYSFSLYSLFAGVNRPISLDFLQVFLYHHVPIIHLLNDLLLKLQLSNTSFKWSTYCNKTIVHSVHFICDSKSYSHVKIFYFNSSTHLNNILMWNIPHHWVFSYWIS